MEVEGIIQEISTNSSEIMPTIQNVVSTVNLGCKLDLKAIALHARNAEYNHKRFSAVIMRIREPKTTALIFSSGKMVCTGAKSEAESKLAARKFARIVQKLGFPAKFMNFKIQNIVGSCDVKFVVKLELFKEHYPDFAKYEPELFPGMVFRMVNPKIVLLIFVSGKIVLTGAQDREDIYTGFRNIFPLLSRFKKILKSSSELKLNSNLFQVGQFKRILGAKPTPQSEKDKIPLGHCGSCWAFGAVESLSDRFCVHFNASFALSVNDLLACCGFLCGKGCNGGSPISAWRYLVQSGVVSEACDPYFDTTGCSHPGCVPLYPTPQCPKKCADSNQIWEQTKHCGQNAYRIKSDPKDIMAEVYQNGPVEVDFEVYEDFAHYKSGVYKHITGDYLGVGRTCCEADRMGNIYQWGGLLGMLFLASESFICFYNYFNPWQNAKGQPKKLKPSEQHSDNHSDLTQRLLTKPPRDNPHTYTGT
ncbi:hypothetical protein KSS87_008837 [Heliosperma pusillum]|nr:hypothetical protein KSS87_008837 [Heliosperma pusillum]